jgi:hypothetical protein
VLIETLIEYLRTGAADDTLPPGISELTGRGSAATSDKPTARVVS